MIVWFRLSYRWNLKLETCLYVIIIIIIMWIEEGETRK